MGARLQAAIVDATAKHNELLFHIAQTGAIVYNAKDRRLNNPRRLG